MSQSNRSFRWLFWVLALLGLAIDQGSKYGVFAWLAERPRYEYVVWRTAEKTGFQIITQYRVDEETGQLILIDGRPVPHVNQGALFGMGREHKALANACFAIVSLVAAIAILFWSRLPATARDAWLCVALGLILGGTLGNFYDRVVFNGVRDFLHWNYLFDWPVFNFADCCLVCGASLLLLQAFLGQPLRGTKKDGEEDAVQSAPLSSELTSVR